MVFRIRTLGTLFATGLAAAVLPANAAYPEKPVRLVVPSPAGGGIDAIARLMAQRLADTGVQFVVENRGGAGGNIGTEFVARAVPDGYTLLMAGSQLVANPTLYGKVGYDPVKDFEPISLLALAPNVLVVHPSMPVHSVRDLIALAKAKPGEVTFAGAGPGSTPHLAGELFAMLSGVKMVHVAYRGTGPAVTGIMGGEVPLMFMTATTAMPLVRAKRVRAVAVTSAKRIAAAPEIPTIAESGLGDYQSAQWYGLLAPAGVPAEALDFMVVRASRFVLAPDVSQRLMDDGAVPVGSTRQSFAAFIRSEFTKWAEVIQRSGAKSG